MDNKKEKLIPSTDLAEFYARKISTSLSLVYGYWEELPNSRTVILKINRELHEIFKQIKARLNRFDLKENVKLYEELMLKLSKLRPLVKTPSKDKETGNRIIKIMKTKDYPLYRKLINDKECLIWECLDMLGLLGKVERQGRRLR